MPNSAPLKAKILITDTSPLITLAAAGDLDVLLYADLPVIIPDAVFYEATHDASRLGAQTILEWRNANMDKVNLVGATVFSNYLATGQKPKGLGELSAQESIQTLPVGPDERALLLMEDPKAVRIINPSSVVITLSTRDYLDALEAEHRIQSADQIYARAHAALRCPGQSSFLAAQPPAHRQAVLDALRTARPIGEIMQSGKPTDPQT
jgi:hypothetical protein